MVEKLSRVKGAGLPRATHRGVLQVAGSRIPCAVLEDGRRVLSLRDVGAAIGKSKGGSLSKKSSRHGGAELPFFVGSNAVKPFVSDELKVVTKAPIVYRSSGGIAHGLPAAALPMVCDAWLRARRASALGARLHHVAERAEVLLSGLAQVGIVALVDEATGYQEDRHARALQEFLDKYLRKEHAAWAKRFPDEFYEHIFRIKGWPWKGRSTNPPQVMAHYTRDIVYQRLAPAVLEELEQRNPMQENGRRVSKHHQWLTPDIGHPELTKHLHLVIALLKLSRTWEQFMDRLDQTAPRLGSTIPIPNMDDPRDYAGLNSTGTDG